MAQLLFINYAVDLGKCLFSTIANISNNAMLILHSFDQPNDESLNYFWHPNNYQDSY